MQPTLVIVAPTPGMVAINGRFAGEAAPDAPLFVPVAACGALYLQYAPLAPGWMPLARKLVFSGGAPLAQSLDDGVCAVCWPGGVTELELSPPRAPEERAALLAPESMPCRICRGAEDFIELAGAKHALPPDADAPRLERLSGCAALIGSARDGDYLLLLSDDLTRLLGALQADAIALESAQVVQALTARGDVAGRGTLERWRAAPDGLALLSAEAVWMRGEPIAPVTPEETVRAAVDAALAGDLDAALRDLSPALRERFSPEAVAQLCTLCLPMKYGPPDGEPCVGLLRAQDARLATVLPLYYRCEPVAGGWQITRLDLPADAAVPPA